MSGPATVLVDRRSATNGRHWEQNDWYCYPVNRTHSEMVKLDSRHDAVYAQALHCLKGYQESPKTISTILSTNQQECLKSLSFSEQTLRLEQIHTATNTCSWVLRHQSYQAWMNSPSGLLWIEGDPGVGKSVLMKHTLQHLEDRFSHHDCLFLSFFVHGQGSDLQRSKLGLFRTILHQVLRQKPDLFSLVLPDYLESCQTMGSWQWSEGKLQTLLEKCLKAACRTTCVMLLVDALDELDEDIALEVIEYFQHMIGSLSEGTSNLRICFSCRHYPAISFNDGYRICVEKENSDDIRHVVESMLKEITDHYAILSLIMKYANGVFQWAVLASGQARKLSREHRMSAYICQKIRDLPKGLHELYSGLLRGASKTTLRLFQWLCLSEVPLNAAALRQALAVSIEQSCSSLQEYEMVLGFEDSVAGVSSMVKTLSKGLAKVTPIALCARRGPHSLQVILIHQSVRDFFMRGGFEFMDKSLSANPVGISNMQLSEACLKFFVTREAEETRSEEYTYPVDDYPRSTASFGKYAHKYWACHAARAEELNVVPKFLLRYFDTPPKSSEGQPDNVPKSQPNEHYKIDARRLYRKGIHSLPRITTFVHLLSQNNLSLMMRYLIDHGYMLDIEDGEGRTPLCIAVIAGMSRVVKLLLETGQINPNFQDRNGRTPLSYAAESGSLEHVKALISSPNVDSNIPNNYGKTPLHYAAVNGHLEVVRALIGSSQVDPNRQDTTGMTPLSQAAFRGIHKITTALLELPTINVNSKDGMGQTALTHAAIRQNNEVVKALLKAHDIKVNSKDVLGRTPLSYAAENGSLEVTQVLVKSSGIDINSQDLSGRTPISYACEKGGRDIVFAILRHEKCNFNKEDINWHMPYSYDVQRSDKYLGSSAWTFGFQDA